MPLSRRYALFAATLKANVLLWAKARHRALRAGKCTMNLLPSHSNAEPLEEMLKLSQLLLETLQLPQKYPNRNTQLLCCG
jgi:hypothetical protein